MSLSISASLGSRELLKIQDGMCFSFELVLRMIDMLEENPAEMSHCQVRACKSKEVILQSWGRRMENEEGKEEERDTERKVWKGKAGNNKEMKEREMEKKQLQFSALG